MHLPAFALAYFPPFCGSGEAALLQETIKFTRDHAGGERGTPLELTRFEELPVPQRVESSIGPILDTQVAPPFSRL